jgi:hypothetical protein
MQAASHTDIDAAPASLSSRIDARSPTEQDVRQAKKITNRRMKDLQRSTVLPSIGKERFRYSGMRKQRWTHASWSVKQCAMQLGSER